jgi:hypothetical protein
MAPNKRRENGTNHISEWMINNGYPAVNSEKTIFKKTKGSDYIIHGLFVDDMMHISSCDELKKEFMDKYSKDFEITGGGLMKTFLGTEVEQSGKTIKLHLDCYIQQVLAEYKVYIKMMLRPKKVPILPRVILKQEDVPELPDQRKQKYYRSFVAKLQFAVTWVRIEITFTVSQLA